MAPGLMSRQLSDGSSSPTYSSSGALSPLRRSEPIAICGFAVRLPGASTSPRAFWDLLSNGRTGQCEVPPSRFNVDGFYHPRGMDRPGSIVTRGGYFLNEDIREFENGFFGINNLEATYMDPQQRKLLEVVYECLENAGVPLEKASGSNTGCFVGNFTFDFITMQTKDADYMSRYSATGLGTTILANRISHVFNLLGPSFVLDTACSSSLYCLHQACLSLENYECDAAIVAGANLVQSAEQHIATMKVGVLSQTSACHSFDASADGYGRADGIGALYVKRLSDALRDGDPIRSVVLGSAVNANGKTAGISLPSAAGQEAVIRKAMAKSGLLPDDITYVECHGTGTKVGDAIEVDALASVFRRTSRNPLLLGAVKSNIGHSEAASGISGVVKSTMALEHGLIPPTHGLQNVNAKLRIEERHFEIPTETTPWPNTSPSALRCIGINSFGYGGANAHVVLQQAPVRPSQSKARRLMIAQSAVLLPLSAASSYSLEARVTDFAQHDFGSTDILDLAHTLGSRRSQLPVRGFLVASRSDAIADSFAKKKLITAYRETSRVSTPFAFVFTGQGSQWAGMCRELFVEFPIFRDTIAEMDAVLQSLPEAPKWTLKEALLDTADTGLINLPERSQPCCTAIQVALVRLLATWGIAPVTTVGHSSGEIAAAYAAGHLSIAEAIAVAFYRGYCVSQAVLQDGAMMAVGLSEEEADEAIGSHDLVGRIRVACVNSPEGVTVSGDAPAIESLYKALGDRGTFARKLKTGGQAYHSHHMLALGDQYQRLLDKTLPLLGVSNRLPRGASFVSSVTVGPKTWGFDGEYWRSNLECQVRFSQAIAAIHGMFEHCFIELGPHSSLELPIKQSLAKAGLAASQVQYAAPIKRNSNALNSALTFAGSLWLLGHEMNWARVNGLETALKSSQNLCQVVTDLPKYRFHYEETLWTESRASIEYRLRKYPRHELLGSLMPGGNGSDFIFRNVLRLDDVSWLRDHQLGDTPVFPGAGYMAMAMEAVTQILHVDAAAAKPTFRFSNLNIVNALPLSTDSSAQAEVFTSMHRSAITNANTSSVWWDFTVSSYVEATSIPHATGSIAVELGEVVLDSKYTPPAGSLESTAKRTWYDKFVKSGLNYGPTFQSLTEFQTPRMKSDAFCSATGPLLVVSDDVHSVYPVHPITLDAMIQLAIVATTKGVPKELIALVPTRLASAVVRTCAAYSGEDCKMQTAVQKTGFGYSDGGVEIVAKDGQVVAQFDSLRLAPYQSGSQAQEDTRHPILRILWKPDVYGLGFMTSRDMESHAQKFADEANSPVSDDGILKMGAILDLLVHKNPVLRILEVDNDSHELTMAVLELLASQTDFKRLASYTTASLSEDSKILGGPVDLQAGERSGKLSEIEGEFDIILIPKIRQLIEGDLEALEKLLAEDACILGVFPNSTSGLFTSSNLEILSCPVSQGQSTLVVARQPYRPTYEALSKNKFLVVERQESKLGAALSHALQAIQGSLDAVLRVNLLDLTPEHVSSHSTVFSLVEVKDPLLSVITDEEMLRVKMMTDGSAHLVWVTNGNLMHGDRPDFALIQGLARALILEQPALRIFTYDVDDTDIDVDVTAQRLVAVLNQPGRKPDLEFAQRKGVVHVGRMVPDDSINAVFRSKQGLETTPVPLRDAGDARLVIEHAGQFDTLFFKQQEPPETIAPTDIRFKVASVGLNAKDYYVLAGRVDTPEANCQLECAGTVVQVGSQVTGFSVGDRLVAMAPSHFQTYQTVPQWACCKLTDEESFDVAATLPLVYATAIYALHHRANICAGESVLIHSGAGGVGIAAIQLAQQAGAEIFTTVSSEEKKQFLMDRFGVKASHIFSSRDTSFLDGVLKATAGRGVDVIINSLTGDQLHATWKCASEFGRFVEIGKLDLTTSGRLEMDPFLKNTTFTAFDLSHLYYSNNERHHALWKQLLSQVLTLYRVGKIIPFEPLRVFDVGEAPQAYRHFASRNRIGKIAINLERPETTVKVHKLKHTTRFDGDKSYVMVGCLGGLGRTLSRWMVSRGARKFAFLGRSGIAKVSARNLVEDLQASGATCVVVKGDVCSAEDVEAVTAAAASMGAIGGVVQAAMGLNEAIFSTMPIMYWHTGIDPKVHGTWHLYNSLCAGGRDSRLDFFLMTSSVSGSVGTATESNYCAGNHFLDHFARFMRSKGMPAVALGLGMISEVGYLHDNPEIEAILLRKGIQAIDADEFIQISDLALSSNASLSIHHAHDDLAVAHVLTGLEAFGLKELRKKGFEGSYPALDDPRANLLASALEGDDAGQWHKQDGNLPAEVAKMVEAGQTLAEAVLDFVRRRFGNLILMKFEAVDVKKPLSNYGMDSMIGAEFRSWFYQSMVVDVPLILLLGKTCTLETLRDLAVATLEGN